MGFLRNAGSRWRRDGGPVATPTTLGRGMSAGPGGTWAWVVIPPAATDELDSNRLVSLTAEQASDLGRLLPHGADFHIKIQWGRWSGQDYLDEEWGQDLTEGAQQLLSLQADRIDANNFPANRYWSGCGSTWPTPAWAPRFRPGRRKRPPGRCRPRRPTVRCRGR